MIESCETPTVRRILYKGSESFPVVIFLQLRGIIVNSFSIDNIITSPLNNLRAIRNVCYKHAEAARNDSSLNGLHLVVHPRFARNGFIAVFRRELGRERRDLHRPSVRPL